MLLLTAVPFAQGPGNVEQSGVDKKGQSSEIKLEKLVAGHLQPGGYIGEHHHAGPGIRWVRSGELTYIQPDKTTVYKAGDYFYETGDITHKAYNYTKHPVVVVNFEVLPADWRGPSAIPVK
jgi:quercetin dioxygenase-like cupin family protein